MSSAAASFRCSPLSYVSLLHPFCLGRLRKCSDCCGRTVYFSLTSLCATIITILACAAPNFQKASWVFGDTTGNSGWDNKGLLFLLCLLNNAYGFMGTDA